MWWTPPARGPRPRCHWPCSPDGWSSAPSSPAACSAGHLVDEPSRGGLPVSAKDNGRYGSMVAVPTVSGWWARRSDPQRIALYTRSSYYGFVAVTPLFALLVVAGSPGVRPFAGALFLLGSVAVTVAALLLTRAGLSAPLSDKRLPPWLLAGSAATALATVGAGMAVVPDGADEGSPLPWVSFLAPLAVLIACSTVWAIRP